MKKNTTLILFVVTSFLFFTTTTHAASTERVQANRVAEISIKSTKAYDNPFTEIELDAIVTQPDGKQLRVPMFWAGKKQWTLRYSSPLTGKHSYRTECSDKNNSSLNGAKGKITVVPYTGDNPLYLHGKLQVTKNQRHFEFADGTPFFWLGDTWWKGLCKRLPWDGFQELTADRVKKGFTVIQIVCGTYPDEPGLLQPSWENEGGMPYLKKDFSVVNPEYFKYADRRFEHLIDAGITPAIVGGWGRAVNLRSVGLEGYKRHYRNLVARYGAYPVIWVLGGETDKSQGPWYAAGEYVHELDPFGRLLTNHSSHLRKAFDDHVIFDYDMSATGHNEWKTVNHVHQQIRKFLKDSPLKPFVSGESCYELHMQMNSAYLQRKQFWMLMLAGAAGHTYGAAGIWHMATAEEHGNWGGWGGQPYDLTTWDEGMHFPGSTQLGRNKALLESLPWQQFQEHPEWVEADAFAAGVPGKIAVIYQPIRGTYKWGGIAVNNIEPGYWSAFYFDPVSGRRYDLGVHDLSGTWKSPNVPSPQDWVLVMQAQKRGETVKLPEIKVGQKCSGKLEPSGATFTKKTGGKWLTINADGTYSGIPADTNAGRNTFLLMLRKPGETDTVIELTINVIGANGEVFMESFGGYKGTRDGQQLKTKLNLAYSGKVSGWTQSGMHAMHAVDRSFGGGEVTPSDWAIMIFEDDVITSAEIDANARRETYRVAFQASPAVYVQESQATKRGDTLLIEVLRKDGSVLKQFTHAPGAWKGKMDFAPQHFEYKGDGSGAVHLRIGPAGGKTSGRFMGAVDNVVVRKR